MVVNTEALERALEAIVDTNTAIEVDGDQIIVSGMVDSPEERSAVIEVLETYLPEATIVDNLATAGVLPEQIGDLQLSESETAGFPGAQPGLRDNESLEPGDFTDQQVLYDPSVASGPSGTHADDDVAEGDEVYIPPTDPPRRPDGEFLGGFQTTADQDDVEVSSEVVPGPADGGLEDAVRTELRQDAATAGLEIDVTSRDGVVRLYGLVDDLDDAENAQAVAARVPGVREVIEQLEVRSTRQGGPGEGGRDGG